MAEAGTGPHRPQSSALGCPHLAEGAQPRAGTGHGQRSDLLTTTCFAQLCCAILCSHGKDKAGVQLCLFIDEKSPYVPSAPPLLQRLPVPAQCCRHGAATPGDPAGPALPRTLLPGTLLVPVGRCSVQGVGQSCSHPGDTSRVAAALWGRQNPTAACPHHAAPTGCWHVKWGHCGDRVEGGRDEAVHRPGGSVGAGCAPDVDPKAPDATFIPGVGCRVRPGPTPPGPGRRTAPGARGSRCRRSRRGGCPHGAGPRPATAQIDRWEGANSTVG